MHCLPCIHANDEAQRVSFASPLSRALCFFRRPLLGSVLVLALLLTRDEDAEDDIRCSSLVDLTAIRFWAGRRERQAAQGSPSEFRNEMKANARRKRSNIHVAAQSCTHACALFCLG